MLGAAWNYAAATGRRVSIEYALIRDINDQAWRADWLGSLLAGRLAHVNLIPLNPTPGSKWTASRPAAQREFVRRLEAHGVPVTVRDTRGREIDGACGQLAASASARPVKARLAPPAAVACRALGVGGGPAGRGGDRGYPGRAAVRRVRPRLDGGLPARFGLRGTLDHRRRGHPHRRLRVPVRRDGAWPGPRPGAGAADRGPLRDRPGQSRRRAPLAGDRGRRVHRPVRLHHRPESRIRRPGRPDRQADAGERRRPHRLRKLARGRRGRAAGRVHRPQRGDRGRLGGPWHGARPVRGRGRPGPGGQGLRAGRRLVATFPGPAERVDRVAQQADPPG